MSVGIVYKSQYGFTEKYARWIRTELNGELIPLSKVFVHELDKYSTLIFGAGIYAGSFGVEKFILRNFKFLENKNIIVFTCGLLNPAYAENQEALNEHIHKTFPAEIRAKISFFHFPGGVDHPKLGLFHRSLISMMKRAITKKAQPTPEDLKFLETYGNMLDFSDPVFIKPLVEYAKSLEELA